MERWRTEKWKSCVSKNIKLKKSDTFRKEMEGNKIRIFLWGIEKPELMREQVIEGVEMWIWWEGIVWTDEALGLYTFSISLAKLMPIISITVCASRVYVCSSQVVIYSVLFFTFHLYRIFRSIAPHLLQSHLTDSLEISVRALMCACVCAHICGYTFLYILVCLHDYLPFSLLSLVNMWWVVR